MPRLICTPRGVDGPVTVPDLGTFAPGPTDELDDETAKLLLATGHFVPLSTPSPRRQPRPRLEE